MVRGGRSLPSIVSEADEAELLRGGTRQFRFEPETLTRIRALRSGSLSAILVDARRELAALHQDHATARRVCELAAKLDDSDDAREGLLEAIDAVVVDALEESRLDYERAAWEREQGGAS